MSAKSGVVDYSAMTDDQLVENRKWLETEMSRRLRKMETDIGRMRRMMGLQEDGSEIGNSRKGKAAKASAGGGGKSGIRWGSKWNTIIADGIGSGKTMDELKALGKPKEALSIYQSARKLVLNGGLAKDGEKIVKGPNFGHDAGVRVYKLPTPPDEIPF